MRSKSAVMTCSVLWMATTTNAQCDQWRQLGDNTPDWWVRSFAHWDGDLIAGGWFVSIGGQAAQGIARWDGTSWSPLTPGVGNVFASVGFDGNLIFGGTFTNVGGQTMNRIARWDGQAWHALGSGMPDYPGGGGTPHALHVHENELIAAGWFLSAGGVSANHIAAWNGVTWRALGSGILGDVPYPSPFPRALATFNGELIVGGSFTIAGGQSVSNIAAWDGTTWRPLGAGVDNGVNALLVFEGELIAGGGFATAGLQPANRVAAWDGTSWRPLADGPAMGVNALHVHGGKLIAAGRVGAGQPLPPYSAAAWDGASWRGLGSAFTHTLTSGTSLGTPITLATYDGELIMGGLFDEAGGQPARYIAAWRDCTSSCYANCDASTTAPILNIDDFICFIAQFADATALSHEQQLTHYANCDNSTTPPVLNVDDFICFIAAFAQGCP
jgi:hypothetical protein